MGVTTRQQKDEALFAAVRERYRGSNPRAYIARRAAFFVAGESGTSLETSRRWLDGGTVTRRLEIEAGVRRLGLKGIFPERRMLRSKPAPPVASESDIATITRIEEKLGVTGTLWLNTGAPFVDFEGPRVKLSTLRDSPNPVALVRRLLKTWPPKGGSRWDAI